MQVRVSVGSFFAATVFIAATCHADEVPADIALDDGYGYVLVHLYGQDDRSVKTLEMREVDTGETRTAIRTRRNARGPESWLEVLAVPAGRYYWSTVQLGFRNSPTYEFDEPGSANYVFEVLPGVVTYIGDWLIDGAWINGEPRVPTTHNTKTLEKFAGKYPRHARHFDLYFSVAGRDPFSAHDLPRFFRQGRG